MQVTKIMPSVKATERAAQAVTREQMQQEFNYQQAEKITNVLLDRGLITVDEFNKIIAENRRTFPTLLSPLF